jgi:hypothetical protein
VDFLYEKFIEFGGYSVMIQQRKTTQLSAGMALAQHPWPLKLAFKKT